ncbi:MAG: twin-arginine translocase TatA/TatE family subunit [Bacteroidetes bacterium]|nr:twin-arginine translocase TatA/TatE family subunit [Bacteroidota bacterium]
MFGISGGEIVIILLVVILVFGPKKIPEIAKFLGKGLREVKKVQREINNEINRYSEDNSISEKMQKDIDVYKEGDKTSENADDNNLTKPEGNTNEVSESDDNSDLPYPYNKAGKFNQE